MLKYSGQDTSAASQRQSLRAHKNTEVLQVGCWGTALQLKNKRSAVNPLMGTAAAVRTMSCR